MPQLQWQSQLNLTRCQKCLNSLQKPPCFSNFSRERKARLKFPLKIYLFKMMFQEFYFKIIACRITQFTENYSLPMSSRITQIHS